MKTNNNHKCVAAFSRNLKLRVIDENTENTDTHGCSTTLYNNNILFVMCCIYTVFYRVSVTSTEKTHFGSEKRVFFFYNQAILGCFGYKIPLFVKTRNTVVTLLPCCYRVFCLKKRQLSEITSIFPAKMTETVTFIRNKNDDNHYFHGKNSLKRAKNTVKTRCVTKITRCVSRYRATIYTKTGLKPAIFTPITSPYPAKNDKY